MVSKSLQTGCPAIADPVPFMHTVFLPGIFMILLTHFNDRMNIGRTPQASAGLQRDELYLTQYAVALGIYDLCYMISLLVCRANADTDAGSYESLSLNNLEAFLGELLITHDITDSSEKHSTDSAPFATILRSAMDYLSQCRDCHSPDYITETHYDSMHAVVSKFEGCIDAIRLIWLSKPNTLLCHDSTHQLFVCVLQLRKQLGLGTIYAPLADLVPEIKSYTPLPAFEMPWKVLESLSDIVTGPLRICAPLPRYKISSPNASAYSQKLRSYDVFLLKNLATVIQTTRVLTASTSTPSDMKSFMKHFEKFVENTEYEISSSTSEEPEVYADTLKSGILLLQIYKDIASQGAIADLLDCVQHVLKRLHSICKNGRDTSSDNACRMLEQLKNDLRKEASM